jgi:hypothetical protein
MSELFPRTCEAAKIAAAIQRLVPKVHGGTARFWGVWFGRPNDNWHVANQAEADGDCLVVYFEGKETLRVWQPLDYKIDSLQFVIRSASRVLWQWYWYGRPHTPDSLMSCDLVRNGGEISFHSTFPIPNGQTPMPGEPAVQLH